MPTIVDPQRHIDALWGKQQTKEKTKYRLMKYVLRFECDNKMLLHNVVTGQLVVLEQAEVGVVESLPKMYEPAMKQLITEHYLVPEDYDEHDPVKKMRLVLRMLTDQQQGCGLTVYTILPTTGCNARCYYCFEHGIRSESMTEDTADDVINFIAAHNYGKLVNLKWFGGEPTLGANRITQICKGLKEKKVPFTSTMTTNGYLFDEEMCTQAKSIWNLQRVVISVDGVGDDYNRIKDYVSVKDNPYERVLRNIGLLIDQRIHVRVRMNFDQSNETEFEELLADISKRVPPNPFIEVCAHYINDVQIVDGKEIHHGTDAWYNEKIHELHEIARKKGYLGFNSRLPSLDYRWCPAASKRAVTITPRGKLVSCYEFMGDEEAIGDLEQGITNCSLDQSWRCFADIAECAECVLFPDCAKIFRCKRNEECLMKTEKLDAARNAAIRNYKTFFKLYGKEGIPK